jgi:hypothetical protein
VKYIESPAEYYGAGTDISLFLAGGITNCPDWQKDLVAKLSDTEITLVNPRRNCWEMRADIEQEQIIWEWKHLIRVDAILFWFPCETDCPIALYELGSWNFRPKKLFIGCHPNYKRKRDVEIQTKLERPFQVIVYSLDELVDQVKEWTAWKLKDYFVRTPDQPMCQKVT